MVLLMKFLPNRRGSDREIGGKIGRDLSQKNSRKTRKRKKARTFRELILSLVSHHETDIRDGATERQKH